MVDVTWTPEPDGSPDPGEVVWAWVPYEEDASRGKDRPVLLLAPTDPGVPADVADWYALGMTSKDHDRDEEQEAAEGRHWIDVGTGGWDRERRPSEVRLDRLLRLPAASVRREGARLERDVFDRVVAEAARFHDLRLGD